MKHSPAFRRQFIVAFAALTGCLILAGLAAALVSEQRKGRRYVELRFKDEAATAAALTHAIFQSTSAQGKRELTRRYGDAIVDLETLDRQPRVKQGGYIVVLDERGRVLRASSSAPADAVGPSAQARSRP